MKSKPRIAAALFAALVALAPAASLGQKQKEPAPQKSQAGERLEPDDKREVRTDVPEGVLANRREQMNEDEQALIPYYNNFMTSYRLGPEDVISVNVFGHDRYSKANIVVPPDGRVDYFFVREGLHVSGKTTRQVADDI